MKTIQVLIVSRDAGNRAFLAERLGGEPGRHITAVSTDEEAVERSCAGAFDVVVAGKEVDAQAVRKLRAVFRTHDADTVFLVQQDNDGDALKDEVKRSLEAKRMKRLQHIDVRDTLAAENPAGGIRLVDAG